MKSVFLILFCFSLRAHAALYDRDGHVYEYLLTPWSSENINWTELSYSNLEKNSSLVYVNHPLGLAGSGVIIMPPSDMSPDKQKVLVLTAGHVAVPKEEFSRYLTGSIINEVPKPFIANADTEYPQTYHFIVTLNHFLDVPENQARHVHVRRIIVATMLGTDLALLELDITYGELKALNITPAPLAQSQPKLGEIITAHGHPVELNLPIAAPGQVIRAESISAEGFNWSYSYAINASVAEGVSGGPAFNKNGEVVGIVNVAARDVNYIQPVSQLREIFENGDVSFEKIRLNPTLSPHLLDGSCNSMLKPK